MAWLAPAFVNLFIDDFIAFILSQAALAMMPILMFLLFFYLLILPITYTLQGMQAGQVEIFLAAPVKPSDVLLGEFLGIAPFYAIGIALIAGFFTAALSPLGLDALQMSITVLVFVIILLSGLWIGTLIAALVRTKFAESARTRDIGKALSLLLALPMIAIMYAMAGGGLLEALANPGTSGLVRTALSLLPSSWGADLIVSFASNPGNIAAIGLETLTRFGGLILFFIAALWLGTKAASRAYRIEPTTFSASRAKPDGFFYKTLRNIGGGKSFGTLLASVFKDHYRRLENLSRIAYIIGIFVLVNVFFVGGFNDPEGSLIMEQFLLPFLAVFIVGQVTVYGKEGLFVYKKAPLGISRFVKAKLIQSLLVAVPTATVITAFSLIFAPQASVLSVLTYIGLIILLIGGNVALALGLALMNPQFSENARSQMGSLMLNAYVVILASMGVFIFSMAILNWSIFYTTLLQNAVVWTLGIIVLYLGKIKVNRIE